MCGRFTETKSKSEILKRFQIARDAFPDFKTRYNIAPHQTVPVILKKEIRELHGFNWGLVPSWAKDASIGDHMINARAETITEKMSFRVPFKWRRCLIVADGFYEWQVKDDIKIPVYIQRRDHELFAFAGLWSRWEAEDHHHSISSCTIITTAAADWMRPIHERMPVILPKEGEAYWLNPDAKENDLLALLRPSPEDIFTVREVSKKVNDPSNDFPELIQ